MAYIQTTCRHFFRPGRLRQNPLLSEWLAATDQQAAWLSLDESDDDPIRFWWYLIAAPQTLSQTSTAPQAELGRYAARQLELGHYSSQTLTFSELQTILTSLLAGLADKIVLVLDDYHIIATALVHESLNFLLAHQPAQLYLIISSRADPPFAG